jgi:uncharacterized protein (DUF427 family)
VSLTSGRGPLSGRPAGRFSAPVPQGVVYVEPFPRRVRGLVDDAVVVESEQVLLVHRAGSPPTYAFPAEAVLDPSLPTTTEPSAEGHVTVPWGAVDAWFEEDEEVFGHPRNPYHRVDCVATSRRLRVEAAGTVVVDSTATTGVYETALAPRLYVDRSEVRGARLVPSSSTSYCPYKGTATWWDLELGDTVVHDAAWSYDDPLPESLPLRGLLGFDEAKVGVTAELPPSA